MWTAMSAPQPSPHAKPFDRTDGVLYALVVFAWGTSWIAIPAQLGVVAPEVSVFYRFALAGALMVAWMLASGRAMRFPPAAHLRFAALGILTFSSNFAIFYYAGLHFPSGLLAVVFSLSTVTNILLARIVFGDAISGALALGAVMGVGGLALVFSPKLMSADFGPSALIGLGAALAGTVLFSIGSMLSRSNQALGLPVLQANAWGMVYGALWLMFWVVVLDRPLIWDERPVYALALGFHVVVSTILAFGAYMTLLGRIGPARAGYASVAFPVIALAISTLVEGYVWTPVALVGAALVLAGNVVILSGGRR